jgi:hypothetical protein
LVQFLGFRSISASFRLHFRSISHLLIDRAVEAKIKETVDMIMKEQSEAEEKHAKVLTFRHFILEFPVFCFPGVFTPVLLLRQIDHAWINAHSRNAIPVRKLIGATCGC